MTGAALLVALRAANVTLRLDGARLRYQAPAGALTAALRAAVAERRDEVLALLAAEAIAADALDAGAATPPHGRTACYVGGDETQAARISGVLPPVDGTSFAALDVDVLLRGAFGEIWLVAKPTGTGRPELTPADVEVIRLVQVEFPGAKVVSVRAAPQEK